MSALQDRSARELWVCQLGTVSYPDGLAMQQHVRARRQAGELPDTLLTLEHPPTYTCGRRASAQELPLPAQRYVERGIEVHPSDRGGRVTYHGPGQLVGYPIMAVADVVAHVRTMESAIIAALAQIGIDGRSRSGEGPDYTGVWVQERKIASIGVHVARGVSTHGFAVNVENDLRPFSWIVACGLPDVRMTSVAQELERGAPGACPPDATLACFRRRLAHTFAQAHGRRQRLVAPRRLGIDAPRRESAASAPERAPDRAREPVLA